MQRCKGALHRYGGVPCVVVRNLWPVVFFFFSVVLYFGFVLGICSDRFPILPLRASTHETPVAQVAPESLPSVSMYCPEVLIHWSLPWRHLRLLVSSQQVWIVRARCATRCRNVVRTWTLPASQQRAPSPSAWFRVRAGSSLRDKKEWNVAVSPTLQSERSESASSGGTGFACRTNITATDVRNVYGMVVCPPQHRLKVQLVNAVLPGGLVVGSVDGHFYSDQNIGFFNTPGQVLRAIDLPYLAGGDFSLAGEVLDPSGWLHALRARTFAPSNDTPTCGDSSGKGRFLMLSVCQMS